MVKTQSISAEMVKRQALICNAVISKSVVS